MSFFIHIYRYGQAVVITVR